MNVFKEIEILFKNPEKYGVSEYLIELHYPKLSNNEKLILSWMCKHIDDYGFVHITIEDRKRIMKEYNITTSTITRILNKLKEFKLIEGEKGTFKIFNSLILDKDVTKSTKLKITFEIE